MTKRQTKKAPRAPKLTGALLRVRPPTKAEKAAYAAAVRRRKDRDRHGDWHPEFDRMGPLSQVEIAELRTMLRESAPAPWAVSHRHIGLTEFDDESAGLGLEIEGPEEARGRGWLAKALEARLIVRAVNALPRLILEVERSRRRERIQRAQR